MWTVEDRWGNEIVLTEERWQHIREGHWELADRLDQVLETVRRGTRKPYPLDPGRFRYSRAWPDLPHNYTHIFHCAIGAGEVHHHGISQTGEVGPWNKN